MATYSSGKFRDHGNREMSIKLRDVTDSSKLYALLKVIEAASDASFVSRRFEEPESSPVAPPETTRHRSAGQPLRPRSIRRSFETRTPP